MISIVTASEMEKISPSREFGRKVKDVVLKPATFGKRNDTPSPMESGSIEGDTPVVCI